MTQIRKSVSKSVSRTAIALLAALALGAAIACGESVAPDLGEPYWADQLLLARNENASRFDLEWKGNRINITGIVDYVDQGNIYLAAGDYLEGVALDGLSQEEQAKWNSGDEVEYACNVGEYVLGTIFMEDCGPAEHGEAISGAGPSNLVRDSLTGASTVLEYWSIPALLITAVLTVTAIARSTWKGWQPAMVALMCLGVLAILYHVGAVLLNYTTVNLLPLTLLAMLSFVGICILGWIILSHDVFPTLNGVPPGTPPAAGHLPNQSGTSASQQGLGTGTIGPPSQLGTPDSAATSLGGPMTTVAAPAPDPSQTIAMQPSAARSMAWLVVTKGPSEGKSVQLKEGNNTIGRSLDNDLQIDDSSVSRSHAMVTVGEDRFTLIDLGSTGGTRVGDHRILGKQVGAGSNITIGQTRLSLVAVDAFQGGSSSGATMVGSPTGSSLSLIVHSGPDAGKSFILASPRNVIGRDPSAQVVLSDPTVSRNHAMIRVEPDRTTISDLGSRSGTHVDGESISGVEIAVGDHIVIGQSEFTLMRPGI